MKLTVGTKILIRCGGRMISSRILLFSPSGEHVFLGAMPSDSDCVSIGWRATALVNIVEILETPRRPVKEEPVEQASHL